MLPISESASTNIVNGVIALAVLILMAEVVIRKTVSISRHFGISEWFIGLTILSIGTSIPEYTSHVVASAEIVAGKIDPLIASGVVLGTNIGSDIVQQNFMVGVVGLFGLLCATKKFMKRDFLIMILTAIILFIFALNKHISRLEGFILFAGYIVYLYFLLKEENHEVDIYLKNHNHKKSPGGILFDILSIILGLGVIVVAAEYILRLAIFFVETYHVGGSMVGVVSLGVATALPELTTSTIAMIKGSRALPLGILIGSNITNPASALGLGAMISGYSVPNAVLWYDLPVKILTAMLLFALIWFSKGMKLRKRYSVLMILLYFAYIAIRIKFFSVDY